MTGVFRAMMYDVLPITRDCDVLSVYEGGNTLVSSARITASLHNLFHSDRYLVNRLHLCGDDAWGTIFLGPPRHVRTAAQYYTYHRLAIRRPVPEVDQEACEFPSFSEGSGTKISDTLVARDRVPARNIILQLPQGSIEQILSDGS